MIHKNLIRIGLIALAVAHSDASANFFKRFASQALNTLRSRDHKHHAETLLLWPA